MKILQIINSLATGGAEKFVVELSNQLSNDHDVILCTVKPVETQMILARNLQTSVQTVTLKCTKKYSLRLLCSLYSLINDIQPDVVHVHSSILVFYIYLVSLCFRATLFVQTIHNELTPAYRKLFRFLNCLRWLNRSFVHVCLSPSILNQFQSSFINLNFIQIYSGIVDLIPSENLNEVKKEVDRLKKSESTRLFLAAGNYSDFKNFMMLVALFRELEAEGQDAILLLAGDAADVNRENFATVAKFKSTHIHQLGLKTNVPDYLYCADALVISSTMEGLPLIALEALSAGLPIITTPAGGMKDIVSDGVHGYIAEDFSKRALLSKLEAFLSLDEDSIRRIRSSNRSLFSNQFTIQLCAKKYIDLFQMKEL